jgi:hypothetical protein
MGNYLNRAKETTVTAGTGTVTLGGAVAGFRTWAAAGAVTTAEYSYLIVDGSAWEVGVGTWTDAASDTLSRTLVESSTGSLLNLSGSATVAQIAAAHDLKFRGARAKKNGDQTAANYTSFTIITWDAEDFDTDTFHDNVTNNQRMTIPTGKGINHVEIIACVNTSLVTADMWHNLSIRKNGTTILNSQTTESGLTGNNVVVSSGPIAVVDGDFFEIGFQVETDTSISLLAASSFFAIKVLG